MAERSEPDGITAIKERISPVSVVGSENVRDAGRLLRDTEPCVTFRQDDLIEFEKKGSWVLLDFGKEVCGGVRILTGFWQHNSAKVRITFGESVSEACASIGEKGAANAQSPRDFTTDLCFWSDVTYGQTGFRFVRIELLDDKPSFIQSIYAVNTLPYFADEAVIRTSDAELNRIIDTAAYTLKLCCQNGYIWDGVKRDRLVWSGDLHQEVITSLYLFGDNINVRNSLSFLKRDTDPDIWMNNIPSYSAWWVISFCDYCYFSGNEGFFDENREYAQAILKKLDSSIDEDGNMRFGGNAVNVYFLDWPTYKSEDAVTGTAMIIRLAAEKFSEFEKNENCENILRKLNGYLSAASEHKQTRAMQILAGRKDGTDTEFLENGYASGYSTFMAYYILTAYSKSGGKKSLDIIKEYFGGMLSRGATTFWEDFDIDWLNGSGRIDRMPENGEKDLHGDYGRYCYWGFRHSLCHGWSSGVLAFMIESVFGIHVGRGCEKITIRPNPMGLMSFDVRLPLPTGSLYVGYKDGKLNWSAPDGVEVCEQ